MHWQSLGRLLFWVRNATLAAGALSLAATLVAYLWVLLTGTSGERAFAPRILDELAVYGLLALSAGLCFGAITASGGRRLSWILGVVPGVPIITLILAVLALSAGTPSEINRIRLDDGRLLMLAIEPVPTDAVYNVWQSEDSFGLVWSRLRDVSLTYSEDGSWTEDPALVLTPNGKRLLVRRGGIWTDCLETTPGLEHCPGVLSSLAWTKPDAWLRQSERIGDLSGLSPGPVESRQPLSEAAREYLSDTDLPHR
ncbi:hypothetical protein [Microvirga lenta]|uniref:hypothetical protein n=1 Tax=Microvirga lenta TaxID=2881337 RepID=UPI001D001700|nr:hypothetical protein [Microvirga lenta]MCB5176384.1 hypothetical protein [Microvirga lenta]